MERLHSLCNRVGIPVMIATLLWAWFSTGSFTEAYRSPGFKFSAIAWVACTGQLTLWMAIRDWLRKRREVKKTVDIIDPKES